MSQLVHLTNHKLNKEDQAEAPAGLKERHESISTANTKEVNIQNIFHRDSCHSVHACT